MIDRQTIERITDAADIVDVVSGFVTLTKDGANYKGLCPFHEEKTPSFVVSPARGYCHCFTCGRGGNAVGFIMEKLHLGYQDALRWLAERYHIEVTEEDEAEEKRKTDERESLFILMEWAQDHFVSNRRETVEGSEVAIPWLALGGYVLDDITRIGLGYAMGGRDILARAALEAGFNEGLLVDAGLCVRTVDGTLADRYRHCVTFPLRTSVGRVMGFIGLALGGDGKLGTCVEAKESAINREGHKAAIASTVNRLIRTDIEATDKERARETDVEAIEYMLMEDIVWHGEATLFKEMKDGNFRDVTLAEYVDRSLEEYGMGLEDATHARMLEEVLRHLGDEGFTAKDYLVHHPDAGIRAVATKLAIAPGPVTMYRPFDAEALYNDVRRNIIALRKEYLQRQLWEVRGDIARAMAEGRDINDLRRRHDEIITERRRLSAETGHIWGDKA